jgi:hypothetical protein
MPTTTKKNYPVWLSQDDWEMISHVLLRYAPKHQSCIDAADKIDSQIEALQVLSGE